MTMRPRLLLGCAFIAGLLANVLRAEDGPRAGIDWPQFRGIQASGVADGHPAAVKWNGETGSNVKWKTAIPGLGHSSPIIWRDQLCVTTAVSGAEDVLGKGIYIPLESVEDGKAQRWEVHCLDKRTGSRKWVAVAHQGVPAVKRHGKSTHANSTLATDGTHLIALFGSEGLYAYNMNGKLLWKRDLGVLDSGYFQTPSAQWAFGSSPVIHDGKVLVQADVQRGSFLAAFDAKSGRELWRTMRDDLPTWSTPTIAVSGNRAQVIVNGHRNVGGYDLETGKAVWWTRGAGDIPVPTPVVHQGVAYITNSHGKGSLIAIRTDAVGEIPVTQNTSTEDSRLLWRHHSGGSYIQTPLVYGDYLYVPGWYGGLVVYELKTGQRVYRQRLGTGLQVFFASPVAAAGRIYVADEDGIVYVFKAGPQFEVLAENSLGEMSLATPAISEGVLFFRTRSQVMAIAEAGNQIQ
jgi:outer membrane protein assembly factor BamB